METFSALLALCAGNSPVPVNSPHKGQWRGALMFTLICARINDWVNNREAGDLRRHLDHYDVIVMNYKVNNDLLDFDIRLIKYAANFIQKSSAQVIKDSLLHGRVHMDWKRARVSPMYKGGGLDSKAIIDQFLSLDILLNLLNPWRAFKLFCTRKVMISYPMANLHISNEILPKPAHTKQSIIGLKT